MKIKTLPRNIRCIFFFLALILASCTPSSSESRQSNDSLSESNVLPSSEVQSSESVTSDKDSSSSEIELDFLDTPLYINRVEWGLGEKMTKYVTNEREYEWYVDQLNTGEHWAENCGPTSVEMAGRYYDPEFRYTAEYARTLYAADGGWWYDKYIQGALKAFGVPFGSITIHNAGVLTRALDLGSVVLINPTMDLVARETNPNHRTGIYYTPGTGHYIIVKGYVIVDDVTFFEVYDPWSIEMRYSDNTLKGKDRYYDAPSLINSLKNWYRVGHTINKIENL